MLHANRRHTLAIAKPCKCLGNLTDAIHIPPQTAESVMKITLAYLLVGSYVTLFYIRYHGTVNQNEAN
jgi:hypothetical protein